METASHTWLKRYPCAVPCLSHYPYVSLGPFQTNLFLLETTETRPHSTQISSCVSLIRGPSLGMIWCENPTCDSSRHRTNTRNSVFPRGPMCLARQGSVLSMRQQPEELDLLTTEAIMPQLWLCNRTLQLMRALFTGCWCEELVDDDTNVAIYYRIHRILSI